MVMKYAHKIFIRIFVKPEEDYNSIKEGLLWFAGFKEEELAKEKIFYIEEDVSGLDDENLMVMKLELNKNKHINDQLSFLKKNFSEKDLDYLLNNRKPDEKSNFFIRLDKDEFQNKKIKLTEQGDCVHIRISLAAFPSNAENAYKVLEEIFLNR